MKKREMVRKETDYITRFRCAGGIGILREEVWTDANGEVVSYNLAFLLPHRFARDHGRVLGYDNAYGVHERHDRGAVEVVRYKDYSTAVRFYREVARIRRSYESESV